jgi:hypothetical protein
MPGMDAQDRATSVWYRVAGLLRRKDLAIDIIAAQIRSAQHQALLEADRVTDPAAKKLLVESARAVMRAQKH